MNFVLDPSTTMTWCFGDEMTDATDAILDQLHILGAIVPAIWSLEVANAFLVAERRLRITENDTARLTQLLQSLPITVDAEGESKVFSEVLTLARAYKLSTYDAAYLELAMRRGLPLATLDARLRTAADRVGVPLL